MSILVLATNAKAESIVDESLKKIAAETINPFKNKEPHSLAITYLFHNGGRETPTSRYVKNMITGHLLSEGGQSITIVDRSDYRFQARESDFGFIFSSMPDLPAPEPVDSILIGEIITSTQARSMVILLKIIDTKTSQILKASVANIQLDKDMASRIGISELNLNRLPKLPSSDKKFNQWAKEASQGFEKAGTNVSLDDQGLVNNDQLLKSRIMRAYLTAELVSAGWKILDREMFFYVALDRDASDQDVSGFPVGDVILRIELESNFIRTVDRKSGRILGQTQYSLASSGSERDQEIGIEQGLSDVLKILEAERRPGKETPLDFTATVGFPNSLDPRPEFSTKLAEYHPQPNIIGLNQNNYVSTFYLETRRRITLNSADPYINNREFAKNETLVRLNTVENRNIQSIKATLMCMLLWGYQLDADSADGSLKTHEYYGPLMDVAMQISQTYSLNSDGTPSPGYWFSVFGPNGVSNELNEREVYASPISFTDILWHSMHPGSTLFTSSRVTPKRSRIPIQSGTASIPMDRNRPTAIFNYKIESVWKDAFPSTLLITIDLEPMKDKLYKIKK